MYKAVADTHAFIWAVTEPAQLSRRVRQFMEVAELDGDVIVISSMSFVEAIYLEEKGRIPYGSFRLLEEEIRNYSFRWKVIPVEYAIARRVAEIPRDVVPDMPDRVIAATALHLKTLS